MSEQNLQKLRELITKSPCYLTFKVTPKSNKNEITGILEYENDKIIKVKIKAPPEKGKANQMLIDFLKENLDIKNPNIKIIAGQNSQKKLLKICQK